MTKKVVWTSCSRLACASVTPAPDVVICVTDSALLAAITCDDLSTYQPTTLAATLTKSWKAVDGCGAGYWSYTLAYDEAELADPTTALTSAQVDSVFCKGCITTWVEDEIRRIICAGSE